MPAKSFRTLGFLRFERHRVEGELEGVVRQFISLCFCAAVIADAAEVLEGMACGLIVRIERSKASGGLEVHDLQTRAEVLMLHRQHEVHATFHFGQWASHGGHARPPFTPPCRRTYRFTGHLKHGKERMLCPQSVEDASLLFVPARQPPQTAALNQAEQVRHAVLDMRVLFARKAVLFEDAMKHAIVEQTVRLASGP